MMSSPTRPCLPCSLDCRGTPVLALQMLSLSRHWGTAPQSLTPHVLQD